MRKFFLACAVILISAANVNSGDIYSMIKNGDIDAARDSLSKLSTAAQRDGNYLFYLSLVERHALKSVELMEAAQKAGVSAIYREEIKYRLAQFMILSGNTRKASKITTNYLTQHEGGKRRPQFMRYSALIDERDKRYDAAISAWMSSAEAEGIPTQLLLALQLRQELRYGENPHQRAALYTSADSSGSSVATARILHGKPLSYNNLHDAAAALQLIQDLDQLEPNSAAAAIIKHTNPCGAAVAASAAEAFEQAYEGDPLAAYGGVLAVSQRVDHAAAQRICDGQRFLEVIVAPGFDEQAEQALAQRWKNVRLLAVGELRPPSGEPLDLKSIPGGILAQTRDRLVADPDQWKHAAGPAPSKAMLDHAAFLWTVTKHIKSNAIAIGKDRQLLGIGAGQVDRVTACRIAIEKAGDRITAQGVTIAASDAFFPFTDGPQLLIDAGVKCIVHPGGSKRDQETLDLCNQHDVTCLLTGIRHFRH
ncbi:MAG: hypothetical protein IH931_05130, partial [candidate division Zixibacteria bacterium]|nr:hypothetical protein [candidate division Zixibacteria bacterium]